MRMEDQSFVVVGGARSDGIGLNFVKQLLKIGVEKIAVFDVVDPSVAVAELKSLSPDKNISFHKVDVRNKAEIENAFKEVINMFGYVDVLINFVGISNESKFEDVLHINLFGTIYSTLIGIDHMSVSKGGRGGMIVNTSSIAGLDPYSCLPAYCASKFGVVGFTKSLAEKNLETQLGIKFVTICPGITKTNLLDVGNDSEPVFYGLNGDKRFSEITDKYGIQTPEECSKILIQVLKISKNGSTWILNKGEYKPVNFTSYVDME